MNSNTHIACLLDVWKLTLCTPCSSMTTISPGCHLTHKGGVHGVESARLRGDHVGGLARQRYIADAQRPEAKRIAQRDELGWGDDPAGVGADDPREGAADDLLPCAAVRVLDESRHDLGVEAAVEGGSLFLQLLAKGFGVQEVAVVGNGAGAELWVVERKRVRVLGAACAGGRVARVAEGEDRARPHVLDGRRREHLRDEAHAAMHAHGRAIRDSDSRRLLAAVLQREQPEVGQVGDIDAPRCADAEHTAHGLVIRSGGSAESRRIGARGQGDGEQRSAHVDRPVSE